MVQPLTLADIIVEPDVLFADLMFRDNRTLWATCVKNALEKVSPEDTESIRSSDFYAKNILENIGTEYLCRFNAGEEPSTEIDPYFERLCRELFLFHVRRKDLNLPQTFSELLKNV